MSVFDRGESSKSIYIFIVCCIYIMVFVVCFWGMGVVWLILYGKLISFFLLECVMFFGICVDGL